MLPLFAVLFAAAPDAMDRPGPGEPAPLFEAEATTGGRFVLKDLIGKQTVVLAFFPKAFTAG